MRAGLAARWESERVPIVKQLGAGHQRARPHGINVADTYRSIILVHGVVRLYHGFVSGGVGDLEHLGVEELFERVGWDGLEVDHRFHLGVEGDEGVPGDVVVVEMATGDGVSSAVSRNKEGVL
jgi:hypothetical protein